MSAREPLYEGKAKIIFKGPEDGTLIPVSYTHLRAHETR